MEGDEGDNIAVERRQSILVTGNDPLRRLGPCRKKAMLDKTIHAGMNNVRVAPWIHEATEVEGRELYQRWGSEGKGP
jgi:hypothetical protein